MFEASKVTKLELMENSEAGKGFTIKLEKDAAPVGGVERVKYVSPRAAAEIPDEGGKEPAFVGGKGEIASPMVGIFYAAPSEGAEPFVRKGDKVKKGDVLCVIEAMKLMNEITSDRDGEIVEIFAENGELVEFGQPLFLIA